MCGIAGIIHRDGAARIGDELTAMLNSMKHRGPDSTGYAIYGPADEMVIVRFVLAEPNDFTGFGMDEKLERNRAEVESRLAKIGAEYLLRWLPPGTHDWKKFVRPSELAAGLEAHGVRLTDLKGMTYTLSGDWRLSRDLDVNYLAFAVKAKKTKK